MTHRLLKPDEKHQTGDEMLDFVRECWIPVPTIHIGEPVGTDSVPCRRIITPADLAQLRAAVSGRKMV